MSGLLKGLQKFFTKDRVMVLVIFILLGMFLLYYSTGKTTVLDSMDTGSMGDYVGASSSSPMLSNYPSSSSSSSLSQPVPSYQPPSITPTGNGYSVQQVANPSELLPNDVNSQWATLNPSSQNNPQTPDLLQAGYHIGLDTVGQTMKNPNLQLRSDPIIDKKEVGPWNMSTVEPDLLRQPLEVGQAGR